MVATVAGHQLLNKQQRMDPGERGDSDLGTMIPWQGSMPATLGLLKMP